MTGGQRAVHLGGHVELTLPPKEVVPLSSDLGRSVLPGADLWSKPGDADGRGAAKLAPVPPLLCPGGAAGGSGSGRAAREGPQQRHHFAAAAGDPRAAPTERDGNPASITGNDNAGKPPRRAPPLRRGGIPHGLGVLEKCLTTSKIFSLLFLLGLALCVPPEYKMGGCIKIWKIWKIGPWDAGVR